MTGSISSPGGDYEKYKNCQVLRNGKSHLITHLIYVLEQALHSIESKAEGEKIKKRALSAE